MWQLYRSEKRRYNSVRDEWDLCDEFDPEYVDYTDSDYNYNDEPDKFDGYFGEPMSDYEPLVNKPDNTIVIDMAESSQSSGLSRHTFYCSNFPMFTDESFDRRNIVGTRFIVKRII